MLSSSGGGRWMPQKSNVASMTAGAQSRDALAGIDLQTAPGISAAVARACSTTHSPGYPSVPRARTGIRSVGRISRTS